MLATNSSGLIILNFFTPTAGLDSPSMVVEWLHPTKRRIGQRLQVPDEWALKYVWVGSFAKQKQVLDDLETNAGKHHRTVTTIELHPNGNCPSLMQVGRSRLAQLRAALHGQGLRLFVFFLIRNPVEWMMHAFREQPRGDACGFNSSLSQSESERTMVECMLPNRQCSIAQSGWLGIASLARRRKTTPASRETCQSVLQLVQSEFDWYGAWEDRDLLRHKLQALATPGQVPLKPTASQDDRLAVNVDPATISALVAKAAGDFALYATAYHHSRCERLRLHGMRASLTVAPPTHFPPSEDWNPHCSRSRTPPPNETAPNETVARKRRQQSRKSF